jgi:integrase
LTVTAPADVRVPAGLSASAQDAAVAIVRRAASANTQASYKSAAGYWAAWHRLRYGVELALPLDEAVVIQFIVDHVLHSPDGGHSFTTDLPPALEAQLIEQGHRARAGALSLATVEHRLAFMAAQHRPAPYSAAPNPCQTSAVRKLMAAARRGYARDARTPAKKDALDAARLQRLLAACDAEIEAPCPSEPAQALSRGQTTAAQRWQATRLAALRDRALLLFAFSSGGRRRSEVAAATRANTRCVAPPAAPGEPGTWVYTLSHSKTNPAGEQRPENHKPIVGRAAAALEAWLAQAAIVEGPIWRKISKWGAVTDAALGAAAVREIVRKRCAQAGLDAEGVFSAHSIRSGFVTETGRRQLPLAEAMAMSGHRSLRVFMGYYRLEQLQGSAAARVMDEPQG